MKRIRADTLDRNKLTKAKDYLISRLEKAGYNARVIGSFGNSRYKDVDILITRETGMDFKQLDRTLFGIIIDVSYPMVFDFWAEKGSKKYHAFVTRRGFEWADVTKEIKEAN